MWGSLSGWLSISRKGSGKLRAEWDNWGKVLWEPWRGWGWEGRGAQTLQSKGHAGWEPGTKERASWESRAGIGEDERPRPGQRGGGMAGRKRGRRNQEGLPASQRGTRGHISHPEAVTLTSTHCPHCAWSGPGAWKTLPQLLTQDIRVLLRDIAKVKFSQQSRRHLLGSLPKSKPFSLEWELHSFYPHHLQGGYGWYHMVPLLWSQQMRASENLSELGHGPFSKNVNWDRKILASDWDNLLNRKD